MYDSAFKIGDFPIITRTSEDIIANSIARRGSTSIDEAVRREFVEVSKFLLYRRPKEFSKILGFVGHKKPLYFLNADGETRDGKWTYYSRRSNESHSVKEELEKPDVGAAVLWVFNPDRELIDETNLPVLYTVGGDRRYGSLHESEVKVALPLFTPDTDGQYTFVFEANPNLFSALHFLRGIKEMDLRTDPTVNTRDNPILEILRRICTGLDRPFDAYNMAKSIQDFYEFIAKQLIKTHFRYALR